MNKEQIYDSQINPLMEQIIEICKSNKIAMLATFAIPTPEDADLCCTSQTPDETGKLPRHMAEASSLIRNGRAAPMMLTTQHADGSKTLTAILG
jgi:hypothetical protein